MRVQGLAPVIIIYALMGASTPKQKPQSQEANRLEVFNDLESNNLNKPYYRGVSVRGNVVIIRLSDRWHRLSRDNQEALCKNLFTLWFALGSVRKLNEKPDDFKFEFRHANSDRVLATWNGLTGLSIKN